MQQKARSQELDCLRCIAVLMVLFRHLPVPPESAPSWIKGPQSFLHQAGWAGVDLFFVLSGFLISGLLFREQQQYGRIDFKRFFIRRGLKIYPGFFALIGATVGIAVVSSWHLPWKRILAEVFFVQNYFEGLWSQTWSIGVEEHFYLSLPWLLIFLAKANPGAKDPFRRLPVIYLGVAASAAIFRCLTAVWISIDPADVGPFCHTYIFPTHLRIDSLFIGVIIGYVFHYHPLALERWVHRWRGALFMVAVITLVPLFVWPLEVRYQYTFGFTVNAVSFAVVLLLTMVRPLGAVRKVGWVLRITAFVGAHSYSIYLWHLGVTMLVGAVSRRFYFPWWFESVGVLTGAIAAGILLAKLIEFPVLRIRDRFFPSRSKPLAAGFASEPAVRSSSKAVNTS